MAKLQDTDTITVSVKDVRTVTAAASCLPDLLSGRSTGLETARLLAVGFELTPYTLLAACIRITNIIDSESAAEGEKFLSELQQRQDMLEKEIADVSRLGK